MTSRLPWIFGLGLLWAFATNLPTITNLGVGMLVGYLVLALTERQARGTGTVARVRKAVVLLLYFLWELVLSNIRVAIEVLSPRYRMKPGVASVRLDARTDLEITMLANMITLTPGTMSLEVSADRRVLYVHGMYLGNREEFERSIKDGFERRLLEVLR
jgi:multicomponent Na+:H+ antiporter subunit E